MLRLRLEASKDLLHLPNSSVAETALAVGFATPQSFARAFRQHTGTTPTHLLVGGDAAALDRCRPAFAVFAREIYHVGDSGAGRALKLVNNLLFVAHTLMAEDALRLAEGLGLDRRSTAAIILDCSGASDAQHVFVEAKWRDTLAFMRPYMVKDASAAAEAARDIRIDLGTLGAVVKAYTPPS